MYSIYVRRRKPKQLEMVPPVINRPCYVGGCNNPKYFIVPDILTDGYILRSFAKKIYGCSS